MLWTVGHSNQPAAALIELLAGAGIELVVDVRRYPMSRRHPQFNRERLAASLAADGIGYRHEVNLGSRLQPRPDSANTAIKDDSLRGFADHTQTPEFQAALDVLIEHSQRLRTAIMCAEGLPAKCHRSLIADLLVSRGIEVVHLTHGESLPHRLSARARLGDGPYLTYPALI